MSLSDHRAPDSLGEWWEFRRPFRHFRATNVLGRARLEAFNSEFRNILDMTSGKTPGPFRMTQTSANYDALMLAITSDLASNFDPFFSESWIRSLYDLFGLPYL